MKHLQYPHHLYPIRNYKLIKVDQWIRDHMYVIRFTADDAPIIDETTLRDNIAKNFKADCWINGMSVSLCGPFRKNDARFVIKQKKIKSYSLPWKPGKNVRLIKPRHVAFVPNRGYLGMKISDVLSVKFDHIFEYKDAGTIKKRTDQCRLILEHDPAINNFWHFEIWIESYNSQGDVRFTNEIAEDKLPSKRNMRKRAEATFMLLRNIVCLPNQTQEVALPQSYYISR